MIEVLRYVTKAGRDLIRDWLDGLHNPKAAARIVMRIDRLTQENFGDCKPVGEGVWELRVDYGPGYRVYYAMVGRKCVLLLCGGDKRRQSADIAEAINCLQDYKQRTSEP